MKRISLVISRMLTLVLLLSSMIVAPIAAQQPAPAKVVYPTDRTVLPIPEPKLPDNTVFDARDATTPPRFEVKAPMRPMFL